MPKDLPKNDSELEVESLGPAKISSPLDRGDGRVSFVSDEERVLLNLYADDVLRYSSTGVQPPSFEMAGPRKKTYFDPAKTKAAIVTCGGLCPGINSVIRAIVLALYHNYGVRNIQGIKFGLQGFIPAYGHPVIDLTPEIVLNVHSRGGCFLGMSRGPQDVGEVVDAIERLNISILFTIGGDGTLKASRAIQKEIAKRGVRTAVIGIPKTIDNDIMYVSRTFGFDTAVETATRAILSAHNEANSVPHGIGLVKVMGRHAGFVAAQATLALPDVNFCLIPEVPFELDGPNGLFERLIERTVERGHSVVLVAEGAGQHLFGEKSKERDASGNIKLHDIGLYLKERIAALFREKGLEMNLKYIDPSYMIRSVVASPTDQIFCGFLGQNAVHAGMAGKTGMLVSLWNNAYVHVPFDLCAGRQRRIDPKGHIWRAVGEVTGQGTLMSS